MDIEDIEKWADQMVREMRKEHEEQRANAHCFVCGLQSRQLSYTNDQKRWVCDTHLALDTSYLEFNVGRMLRDYEAAGWLKNDDQKKRLVEQWIEQWEHKREHKPVNIPEEFALQSDRRQLSLWEGETVARQ